MGKKSKFSPVQIVGIVIIVLAVILMIIGSMSGRIVKAGVETAGSKVLGVNVTLDEANLKIFSGKIELEELVIANPEEYEHASFLEAGKIYVKANVGSMLSDTVQIEKIQLDDIMVVVEQKGLSSNLNDILSALPSKESAPKAEPTEKSEGKKLQIDLLEITNVNVKVKLLPIPGKTDTMSIKIDSITMKDIGKKKNVDLAALTERIVKAIAEAIVKNGSDLLPKDMMKNLGESSIEMMQDAGKKASESVIKGAGDKLKGLLGGKKE